jgi:hypothetical protein
MAQIEYCDRPSETSWNPNWTVANLCDEAEQADIDTWLAYSDLAWFSEPEILLVHDERAERLRPEFEKLAKQWKRETSIAGSLSKIVIHPAYQRIMAMGPEVIPLILRDLSESPAHWFWAMHNLVPKGSDPAEGATTIKDATRAWLDWGKREGYL